MVDLNNISLRDEVVRYLNSIPNAHEYEAYYEWSGCPCGISRQGGNALILSAFTQGVNVDTYLWCGHRWNPESVDHEVRGLADMLIPNNRDRWRFELPILRAVFQMRNLPVNGGLSAKTVADLCGLSVPRAAYVAYVVWGE